MTRSPARFLARPTTSLLAAVAIAGGMSITAMSPAAAQSSVPRPGPVRALTSTVTGLACANINSLRLCSHGDDAALRPSTVSGEKGAQASTASTRVGCYGDGTSGPRVVAAYLRPTGSADRFGQYVDRFRGWAGAIEKSVDDSAHQTKGARHVRFATTPGANCSLQILRLTLPADTFSSFTGTVQALQKRGFDHEGTKYLLWTEANVYCGVASTYDDDKASSDNLNNGRLPTYARVDRNCWGYAEAHEVMHMLGSISPHAPHATAGFHCNDGFDLMCYDDGSARSTQHSVCGSAQARLFDCGHDDYFSTAPARGSWLAGHWNAALSSFLSPAWTESSPPAPTSSSAPAPGTEDSAVTSSPSPSPHPLVSLPPLGAGGA